MASPGKPVAIAHTKELEPGDIVRVAFAPGHLGFFKYGPEAVFVVSRTTSDGTVYFKDSRASVLGPLRGTRQELLQELRKLSDFLDLKVMRPDASKAIPEPSEEALEDDLYDEDSEALVDYSAPMPLGNVGSITPPASLFVGGVLLTGLVWYFHNRKQQEDD